ncbi:unnamed protein product, partial [Musa acuminata subsp. malaccensis]
MILLFGPGSSNSPCRENGAGEHKQNPQLIQVAVLYELIRASLVG